MNEIKREVRREVVQRLRKLIQFRNEYPAFDGDFSVLESDAAAIHLQWQKDAKVCSLDIDLNVMKSVITYVDEQGAQVEYVI